MVPKNFFTANSALLFLLLFVFSSAASAGVIELPQTGQTTIYYSGDDGDIQSGAPWPNPRFTTAGAACITDNLTGLTWAQNGNLPPTGAVAWEAALAYVASLNVGLGMCDHTDWRLPNLNELATLLNASQADSAAWLNSSAQGFNGVRMAKYWTSTTDADLTLRAWTVDMIVGAISGYNKVSNTFFVLPVRGTTFGPGEVPATGQTFSYTTTTGEDGDLEQGVLLPSPRFQVNVDGTSTDRLTGLVWLGDANCIMTHYPSFDAGGTYGPAIGGQVIWQRALDFVAGMNNGSYPLCDGGGHHDWRLPDKNELRSFTNYESSSSNYRAFLMTDYGFSNIQPNLYWSSTTSANDPNNAAWTMQMWGRDISPAGKGVWRYVWPVRSAPNIEVTPPSFDFGAVYVWDTKVQTFTVSNEGSADLLLYSLSLAVPSADFPIMNDGCSGALLRPSEACTVDVAFRPVDTGGNASLVIPSTDTNRLPVEVPLQGGGIDCSYLPNQGVQIVNGYCVPFPIFSHICDSIEGAYGHADATDMIKVRMISFTENVNFSLGKTVTLHGGYDCMFLDSTYYSTITGSLTITSGTVTILNIIIQ